MTTVNLGAPWHESELGTIDGGDVGGDIQVSDSLARRWQTADSGPGEVIDFSVYAAVEGAETGYNTFPTKSWVQIQVWYCKCEDVDDPGGTEIYADYLNWDDYEGTVESIVAGLSLYEVWATLAQLDRM